MLSQHIPPPTLDWTGAIIVTWVQTAVIGGLIIRQSDLFGTIQAQNGFWWQNNTSASTSTIFPLLARSASVYFLDSFAIINHWFCRRGNDGGEVQKDRRGEQGETSPMNSGRQESSGREMMEGKEMRLNGQRGRRDERK